MFAVAVHALAILGIGFEFMRSHSAPPSTIEVILTKTKNADESDDAQVIAEYNQKQSGSVDYDSRPTSPSMTQNTFSEKNKISQLESFDNTSHTEQGEIIVKSKQSDKLIAENRTVGQLNNKSTQKSQQSTQNITQLISELSRERQLYAKRPKINHIDTLSAKSAIEAKYIKDWVEKVEITGNKNYPTRARQKNLSGTLILSVLINKDGKVVSSSIQKSSGLSVLDNAAKNIVSMAAPFKQFPIEMREQYDQLMITRTWIYHSNNSLLTE